MKKDLRRAIVVTFSVILVEILLFAAFGVFYFLDLFTIQDYVRENFTMIFFAFIGLFIIDFILVWIAFVRFSRIRTKSDLYTASLLGSDIQEAYNFGMIGLIVVDDDDNIIWISRFFEERQFSILDENIITWQHDLFKLKNLETDSIQLTISSRIYNIKYLSEARLYIFQDVTDYETSIYDLTQHKIVLGYIQIDNFSEIARSKDSIEVTNLLRNVITEYATANKLAIRSYKDESYFVVCDYQALQKMEDDKFSILDKARKVGKTRGVQTTLSLGLSCNFGDTVTMYEMARDALETANSRGGDQVVVSKYNQETEYYGGISEASESHNKTMVRSKYNSLVSEISKSRRVLIMGHTFMDMDALGACLGIKAICEYCNKEAYIVFDPNKTENQTRAALNTAFDREQKEAIMISSSQALSNKYSDMNTLLVIVDVHSAPRTMCPELVNLISRIIIIDHHRLGDDHIDNILEYLEPSASSTCEMIMALMKYANVNPRIPLNPVYATIMLSGIFLDTNFYKSKSTTQSAFEASMLLKEYGADNSRADDYLKNRFEEYTAIANLVEKMTIELKSLGVCAIGEDGEDIVLGDDEIGKVANQCMEVKGINAAFCIAKIDARNDKIKISCRSNGAINVQLIAERLGGGGNVTAAATVLVGQTVASAKAILLKLLKENMNDFM